MQLLAEIAPGVKRGETTDHATRVDLEGRNLVIHAGGDVVAGTSSQSDRQAAELQRRPPLVGASKSLSTLGHDVFNFRSCIFKLYYVHTQFLSN
jgi:hypothetical protein